MPLAAYGGRADIMGIIAPDGPVYQAGTLSGNPVAVAAGLTTLALLAPATHPGAYEQLEATSKALGDGLATLGREAGIPLTVNRVGSMLTAFFVAGDGDQVWSYDDAKRCDTRRFSRWFSEMLRRGIYLPPSQFEAAFVSLAHDDRAVDRTLSAARESLAAL